MDNTSLQHQALQKLTLLDCQFALLRGASTLDINGDIDIVVNDIDKCKVVLDSLGYILFECSLYNHKYIKFDKNFREWIHMDIHTAICVANIVAPRSYTKEIINTSFIDENKIPRLNESHELVLLFLHVALNKGFIVKKYRNFIYNFDLDNLMNIEKNYDFLPGQFIEYYKIIKDLQKREINEIDAIRFVINQFPLFMPAKSNFLRRFYRRAASFINGNKVIAFLGPDGSGKSTVVDSLIKLRWPIIRGQYMGPGRMDEIRLSFKNMLMFFDKIRRKSNKSSIIGMLSRILWQVICYIDFLERVYRHIWFWGSKGVVLFDRYACDMYFRKPTKINEIIFLKLFPKPKHVFLCVGDAELINKRKPELSVSEITNTIDLYRKKLKQYNINFVEINTTHFSSEGVIDKVVLDLIKHDWYH